MYIAYFVNQLTGELYRSNSPRYDKCNVYYPYFNVTGWSRIDEKLFNVLNNVYNYAYVQGIESVKKGDL